MDGTTAYVLLKGEIDALSGPEIYQAVSDYLEANPTALQDSLGLKESGGKLCVVMNES